MGTGILSLTEWSRTNICQLLFSLALSTMPGTAGAVLISKGSLRYHSFHRWAGSRMRKAGLQISPVHSRTHCVLWAKYKWLQGLKETGIASIYKKSEKHFMLFRWALAERIQIGNSVVSIATFTEQVFCASHCSKYYAHNNSMTPLIVLTQKLWLLPSCI